MPAAEVTTKPTSVQATVTSANTGTSRGSAVEGAWAPASRSVPKNRRTTTYSAPMAASQGRAVRAAKRVKLRPLVAKASRLVRLDTGSSSEAVFDRWVQAYTWGLGRAPMRAAVAKTTGVSSTTVASRLSTAVIREAAANTCTSKRRGHPAAPRAIQAPQAWNRPSSSHSRARTRTAARKPITGPSRAASAAASSRGMAPVAMTTPAAGTATTASGQPHGRITAQARTARSRAAESAPARDASRGRAFRGVELSGAEPVRGGACEARKPGAADDHTEIARPRRRARHAPLVLPCPGSTQPWF